MTTHQEIAQTIVQQLGNVTLSMLGAKDLGAFAPGDNDLGGLGFKIKGSRKANYVKITLTAADLYNIEFGKIKKFDYAKGVVEEGIYFDMLHDAIERNTGLYTRM